ncbi:MAG: efflux RND transporter periplasmic adaptor subunit, partial [Caldilineaceae bacterium]|nr:efflux RND transporter periplasmic adaptor subunit [Caldilineaceae bacterium]
MKDLLKDLLVVLIALVIFAGGFYLGSHPALIAGAANQVGLGDVYTQQIAPALGLTTTTQAATTQTDAATTAIANGFAPPTGAFEIGDDQTVELVAVAGGAAEVTAPGVIMAAATEAVDVPATAKIAAVAVRKGDTVAAGDALFALDTTDLEAAVTDALAAVQAAGDGDNAVDAQAALETAAQNLAAAQVTAPIAGTVIAVNVAIGDSVDAGSPAVVIATDSALDVALNVSPDVAAQLSVDQPVTIRVDGADFAATIAEIAESDGPNFPVLIHLDADAAAQLEPGMT